MKVVFSVESIVDQEGAGEILPDMIVDLIEIGGYFDPFEVDAAEGLVVEQRMEGF